MAESLCAQTDEVIVNGSRDAQSGAGWSQTHPSSSCYSDEENVDVGREFENLSHWVCCVCIVTFDLELGQAIEVNPADYSLTVSHYTSFFP